MELGSKVKVRGLYGVIKFMGFTSFAPGEWIGIELQSPKGKNNGCIQGVRYFECQEKHGIFVRKTQVNILQQSTESKDGELIFSLDKQEAELKSETNRAIPLEEPSQMILEEGEESSRLGRENNEAANKLKQYDRMAATINQFEEHREHWMSSQRDLLQKLRDSERATQEGLKRSASLEKELLELHEALELATLDKEMAEERAELLSFEFQSLKEENEELRQEISVLKEEMASDCTESKAGSAALRSLEAQNMRLKEALLRLRDLSSSESFEARNTLAALQKEVSSLRAVEEKYAEEKKAKELLEGQVDELKLQLDDAATAETLVEKLTEKNLHLEEKLRALKNSAEQLELLLQMAEEMEVHHADIQRRLTEELDFCKSELSEENCRLRLANEKITALEQTISKYKSLVAALNEQILSLRQSSDVMAGTQNSSQLELSLSFQLKEALSKAQNQALDMTLKTRLLDEYRLHVELVQLFMLSSFRQDQGVIEAILLLSRLLLKATSIAEHLRHMFQLDLYLDPLSHSPETDISLLTYVAQLLKRLVDISATVTEVGVKLYSSTEEELLSLLAYTKDLNLSENTLDEIKKLADSGNLSSSYELHTLDSVSDCLQSLLRATAKSTRSPVNSPLLRNMLALFLSALEVLLSDFKTIIRESEPSEFPITSLATCFWKLRNSVKRALERLPSVTVLGVDPSWYKAMAYKSNGRVAADLQNNLSILLERLADFSNVLSTCKKMGTSTLCTLVDPAAGEATTMRLERVLTDCDLETRSTEFMRLLCAFIETAAPSSEPGKVHPLLLRAKTYKEALREHAEYKRKLDFKEEETSEYVTQLQQKDTVISECKVKIDCLTRKVEQMAFQASQAKECKGRILLLESSEVKLKETINELRSDIEILKAKKHNLERSSRDKNTDQGIRSSAATEKPTWFENSSDSSRTSERSSTFQLDSTAINCLYKLLDQNIRLKNELNTAQLWDVPPLQLVTYYPTQAEATLRKYQQEVTKWIVRQTVVNVAKDAAGAKENYLATQHQTGVHLADMLSDLSKYRVFLSKKGNIAKAAQEKLKLLGTIDLPRGPKLADDAVVLNRKQLVSLHKTFVS
ncbi:uncharacterized protein LOC135121745 [Zophobas morio]|uniref:uncharacterized protein LOC135121745 n=1 Tax=Zophobas morio TaxID=2755281 RepID=UPI003083481E